MNTTFFTPYKPLVVAELGTAHQGDIVRAKALVDAAARAGADCIKFQMVYADEILHPDTGEVPLPGGTIRLYDRFKQLEVPVHFFTEIKTYIESKNLLFMCTPFGIESARQVRSLKPPMMKIASPELNYVSLLEEVASYGLPTILSSGVSRLGDIELALSYFNPDTVCLLHCITAYPAPETEYNLRVIENLSHVFGVATGVSDHSMDQELVPVLSVAMGASVIEKHFCLSRNDPGLDDPIALPPEEFSVMVQSVRTAQHFIEEKGITEGRNSIYEWLREQRGNDLIEQILGDGVKRLAPSEQENYERTNRSLHARKDIVQGQTIGEDDVAVLRTEKQLRPGLHPLWEKKVIGRRATNFIPAGQGIRFEDV